MKVQTIIKHSLLVATLALNISTNAQESQDAERVRATHINAAHKLGLDGQDSLQYGGWQQYRIGGYGDMVAAFKDYGTNRFYGHPEGNPKEHRSTISIPRFVVAGDYKFNSKWVLGAEIEFESGGTGTAYELENTENDEYETEIEKGGEVALEQFHITRLIDRSFNIRVGHFVLPVGQNNAHHESITFFGTVRPEGEMTIVPNTWHETGLELFGTLGRKVCTFDYQLMVVAGLNAQGFNRNNWVAGGKQGIFEEDNFTCPAYVARADWRPIKGLRLGAAFYYCPNTLDNAEKTHNFSTYTSGKAPLRLYNIEGQYRNSFIEARANVLWGSLGNSDAISKANNNAYKNSPYSKVMPVAHRSIACGGEVGVNLRGCINTVRMPEIIPFVRYEHYDPQQSLAKGLDAMSSPAAGRLKTDIYIVGANWKALPNLVVKADYTNRRIGGGDFNSENELAIGVAWAGWFSKH